MIIDIIAILSLIISLLSLGYLFAINAQYDRAAKDLADKVLEFAEVTRQAAEANNSIATHIVKLEGRLESVEFWKSNPTASTTPTSHQGWGSKR